jgi:hypothetical protein
MLIITTYITYICITAAVTVWVAKSLHTHGRSFLVDAFRGNESLADSVNHLLVVGFYLVNLGYVSYVLKMDRRPVDAASAIELLSAKLGLVLLILGAMHFFNVYVLSRFRRSALVEKLMPPVTPDFSVQGN